MIYIPNNDIVDPLISLGIPISKRVYKPGSHSIDQTSRNYLFDDAFLLFQKSPIFGSQFVTTGGGYPHNLLIEVPMSLGIIGLIFFFYILINIFFKLYKIFLIPNLQIEIFGIICVCLIVLFLGLTSGSIFVNPEETFPIIVKLKVKNEVDGVITSIKIWKTDEEGDDIISLICDAKGRDFETMSQILEEATIINTVTGNPMVRTYILCKLIILSFFKSWNLKDSETGNLIPITNENIGKTRHEIIRALAQEWLKLTSGK